MFAEKLRKETPVMLKIAIASTIVSIPLVAQTPIESDWLKGGALTVLAGLLVLMLWRVLPAMHKDHQETIRQVHESHKQSTTEVCATFRDCTHEIKAGQHEIKLAIDEGNKQQISLLTTMLPGAKKP